MATKKKTTKRRPKSAEPAKRPRGRPPHDPPLVRVTADIPQAVHARFKDAAKSAGVTVHRLLVDWLSRF